MSILNLLKSDERNLSQIMTNKKIRTCEVISHIQSTQYRSICELYSNQNKGYSVKVISDSISLFEEFTFQAEKTKNQLDVINQFEKECLNRFTCFGEFSLEFIKAEHGEEIIFK